MRVKKRNGEFEDVSFDKVLRRVQRQCDNLSKEVNPFVLAQKVISGVYDGVETKQLDSLASETAAYMTTIHPDYDTLAARLVISNLQKETQEDFASLIKELYEYVNPKNGKHSPLIAKDVHDIIQQHKEEIQKVIDYKRDFGYSYFGFKTLCKGYLLQVDGQIKERPQHMLMRVSIGIHKENLEEAFKTYDLMSRKIFTHASPTMFNAGTPIPQCSSCFLLNMTEDSIDGIYETLRRCAKISKCAGGIGLSVHNIRSAGSYIAGTNGTSNGLVPMLRVFNATARYVDQGGGKRKGAFAMYIEPHHPDIFDVLQLRKNNGPEEFRARDLFYALWVPDLFMKRVESNQKWTLFCPDSCPKLHQTYGEEFEQLYEQYEREGKGVKTVNAQELWFAIVESQIETGTPYMLYKDACNTKSNQKNLGTIMGSNLCTEVVQYTSKDEIAVCNLASVSLKEFVVHSLFDHDALGKVICQMVRNLNKVIDENYYPLPEAEHSNRKHRPIGLGVQGLAETFFLMRYPYESEEAKELNRDIFETIYYYACLESCELAKKDGPYESFAGSPASKGFLQFDLWNTPIFSIRYPWDSLKQDIIKYGLRNSLLVAPMPTASTAQILGNTESFEPISSNIFSRSTLAGTFTLVNRFLVDDLTKLGLWNHEMKNRIIAEKGSIQGILEIPQNIKELYKTVWEISQKNILNMAADRGVFIDQSQSLNIHMREPTFAKLTSMHFHGWRLGLKTGMYYLRSKSAADAIQFTVDNEWKKTSLANLAYKPPKEEGENMVCEMKDGCLSCGC